MGSLRSLEICVLGVSCLNSLRVLISEYEVFKFIFCLMFNAYLLLGFCAQEWGLWTLWRSVFQGMILMYLKVYVQGVKFLNPFRVCVPNLNLWCLGFFIHDVSVSLKMWVRRFESKVFWSVSRVCGLQNLWRCLSQGLSLMYLESEFRIWGFKCLNYLCSTVWV